MPPPSPAHHLPPPHPRPARRPAWAPLGALVLLALLAGGRPAGAGGEAAEVAAVQRLLRSEDPSERAAALRRLAGLEGAAAERVLLERLDDPHPYVRRTAAALLGQLPGGPARRPLEARLARLRAPVARAEALRAAALWADEAGRALLVGALSDRDPGVRHEAVLWLDRLEGEPVEAPLEGALLDRDGAVRAAALAALARRGRRTGLEAGLGDPDPRVRLAALEGSVATAPPDGDGHAAAVAVRRGLTDAVWWVRRVAAELCGAVGDVGLLAPLIDRLEDERACVAEAAHATLVAWTGIPFDPDAARWRAWLAEQGDVPEVRAPEAPPPPPADGRTVSAVPFLDLPLRSRHLGFVLDVSGSMAEGEPDGRSRWAHVVEALDRALEGLAAEGGAPARVNVHVFSDEVASVFPAARPLGAASRAAIHRFLAEHPPGGRTALYDGIAAGLADEEVDTLVVLSDGAPSAGAFFTKTDLLAEVARLNRWRRVRIDVVSVGGGGVARRWRDVLRRLAAAHRGRCLER